jgi:hypothetical protein
LLTNGQTSFTNAEWGKMRRNQKCETNEPGWVGGGGGGERGKEVSLWSENQTRRVGRTSKHQRKYKKRKARKASDTGQAATKTMKTATCGTRKNVVKATLSMSTKRSELEQRWQRKKEGEREKKHMYIHTQKNTPWFTAAATITKPKQKQITYEIL